MRIHFIAIGGAAMHNLALALHDAGHHVTGSDDDIKDPSRSRLEEAGLLPPAMGWHPERIQPECDVVVLGMHAREDNPELLRALDLNLTVQSYPEFLFEATKRKHRVVIGGSHGKTTITSMVLHVLHQLERPTDFMVGAQLHGFDRMVQLETDHDMVVLEGDEYLSSPIDRRSKFHWYAPQTTLLTGIAWDHINVFPTEADYVETFRTYLQTLPENATVIHCLEDKLLNQTLSECHRTDLLMKGYVTPEHMASGDNLSKIVWPDGGQTFTPLRGTHNMQNLSGARTLCQTLGVLTNDFDQVIQSFRGAARRLEMVADDPSQNWTVFRDFAHAPSKLNATTEGIRSAYPGRKLVAVFELHTFSSLNPDFLPTYAGSLATADEALVFYDPAVVRAKHLPDLAPEQVKTAFDQMDLQVFTSVQELEFHLFNLEKNNAVVLLMSSGYFSGLQWPQD